MFGIKRPELILNEWNYIKGWMCEEWLYSLRAERGLKGSSFIAGSMCIGQASELDMLMYYDARPCGMSGIFDTDTLAPRKGYYAFLGFKELRKLENSAKTDVQNENIYTCAATNGQDHALFFTRYEDADTAETEEIHLNIQGIDASNGVLAEFYLLDEENNSALIRKEAFPRNNFQIKLKIKLFDTYLIKFKPL
jgi:hypothetical protein